MVVINDVVIIFKKGEVREKKKSKAQKSDEQKEGDFVLATLFFQLFAINIMNF